MRIIACGDALFSGGNLAGRLDPRLVSLLQNADAVFANAEFICPAKTTPPAPRRFITAVGEEAIDELLSIGVDLLSFANNHTGDFGAQGVIDTLEACERRGVMAAGIGRSLDEARMPQFHDADTGRIAVIATGTTRSAEFTASNAGIGIPARPGLNPLRWKRSYVLNDEQFAQIKGIEESLGIATSREEIMRIEVIPDPGQDKLQFGSFFEGSLWFERGSSTYIKYDMNADDRDAILRNVRDAANRSEVVLVSLHTHEGTEENWYSPRPVPFIEEFARAAIDAGATAVIGHGPHMLRGVEIYKGKPIFYSLGSLLMEFEAGMQKMSPEMYAAYGFGRDALPSDLHMSRAADVDGTPIGFNGDPRFSRSVVAILDITDDGVAVDLVPIDLDMNRARRSERGLPAIADAALAQEIARDVADLSLYWGTEIDFDLNSGIIQVRAGK